MADVKLKNGFFQIATAIAEALAKIRISGVENQCLWVIIRKTYGWSKKEDWISLSQFVEGTGLLKPNIVKAINGLVKQIIINAKNGLIQNNTIKMQKRTIAPQKIIKFINQLPPVIII